MLNQLIRASGVVARVALERHLFTVIDVRNLTIIINPPNKKKPEANDAIVTLVNGNHCAHPRETVTKEDVKRLIDRGRELASIIV